MPGTKRLPFAHRPRRFQSGQSLVLVALLMPVLIGFLGLGLDYGRLVVERRNLQNTADSAVMAGVVNLPTSTQQATTDATSYLGKNGYTAGSNGAANPTISYSQTYSNNDTISVSLTRSVSLMLLPVLGVSSKNVSASAAAVEGTTGSITGGPSAGAPGGAPGGGIGAAPIAVDASLQGNTTGLQPAGGQGNGNYVNVAILNTAAFGSHQNLLNALQNGTNDTISIGGSYATSQPDDSQWRASVVATIQARITAGAARGDTSSNFTASSPQLFVVPTVNGGFPNAPSPVTIAGFRAFFVTSIDPQGNWMRGTFVSASLPQGTITPGAPFGGVRSFRQLQ